MHMQKANPKEEKKLHIQTTIGKNLYTPNESKILTNGRFTTESIPGAFCPKCSPMSFYVCKQHLDTMGYLIFSILI